MSKYNATAVGNCAAIIRGANTTSAGDSNTAAFGNNNGIAASTLRQSDAFGSRATDSDIGGLNRSGRTGQQQDRGAD